MDWKNAAAWFLLERVMWLLKGLCKFAAADNEHIYSLGADGINFFFDNFCHGSIQYSLHYGCFRVGCPRWSRNNSSCFMLWKPWPKGNWNTFKHQSEWPLSSNSDLTFYESWLPPSLAQPCFDFCITLLLLLFLFAEFGLVALLFLFVLVYFPAKPPKPPSFSAAKKKVDYIEGGKRLMR